jgi:hypothetical protein
VKKRETSFFAHPFVYTFWPHMTAVMQTNPALAVADDEDDVALAAFLAPNWGRFDQDKLVSFIRFYFLFRDISWVCETKPNLTARDITGPSA